MLHIISFVNHTRANRLFSRLGIPVAFVFLGLSQPLLASQETKVAEIPSQEPTVTHYSGHIAKALYQATRTGKLYGVEAPREATSLPDVEGNKQRAAAYIKRVHEIVVLSSKKELITFGIRLVASLLEIGVMSYIGMKWLRRARNPNLIVGRSALLLVPGTRLLHVAYGTVSLPLFLLEEILGWGIFGAVMLFEDDQISERTKSGFFIAFTLSYSILLLKRLVFNGHLAAYWHFWNHPERYADAVLQAEIMYMGQKDLMNTEQQAYVEQRLHDVREALAMLPNVLRYGAQKLSNVHKDMAEQLTEATALVTTTYRASNPIHAKQTAWGIYDHFKLFSPDIASAMNIAFWMYEHNTDLTRQTPPASVQPVVILLEGELGEGQHEAVQKLAEVMNITPIWLSVTANKEDLFGSSASAGRYNEACAEVYAKLGYVPNNLLVLNDDQHVLNENDPLPEHIFWLLHSEDTEFFNVFFQTMLPRPNGVIVLIGKTGLHRHPALVNRCDTVISFHASRTLMNKRAVVKKYIETFVRDYAQFGVTEDQITQEDVTAILERARDVTRQKLIETICHEYLLDEKVLPQYRKQVHSTSPGDSSSKQ